MSSCVFAEITGAGYIAYCTEPLLDSGETALLTMEDENPWAQEPAVEQQQEHSPAAPLTEETHSLRTPSPHKNHIRRQPVSPSRKMSSIGIKTSDLVFGVCIVNFHHLRGPEIEYSSCIDDCTLDLAQLWPYLPFQALPDGAHSFEETFACFTLDYPDPKGQETTLFALSCARQISADDLIEKDKDVTRSSVQKAIVVLLRQPLYGQIREKLSMVTKAFFDQRNFSDTSIVDLLYQNLKDIYQGDSTVVDESDFYSGISLRELIRDYKKDILVILKAMILEKRVTFYGSNPTSLCLAELAFISLIPNLINNLRDCSSPNLNTYAETLQMVTSFQMSDRNSVLSFAGLPLQLFGRGGVFAPYSPLQQFDDLKFIDHYVIGTSNALLLSQKSNMSDVLINLDTHVVEILDQSLTHALQLSSHDKKWCQQLYNAVNSSWVEDYSGFEGSDDYIRWQYEDYLTGMLSCVKYNEYLEKNIGNDLAAKDYDTNQLKHFNLEFIKLWKQTANYQLFDSTTDDHIFDVFEPKHIHSDESRSLSEKFQTFKNENAKKFEVYKKSLRARETQKDHDAPQRSKPSPSPGKLWGWYSKRLNQ